MLSLFFGCFFIFAATGAYELTNDDAYGASLVAWRIATTGEPWIDDLDTAAIGIARNHAPGALTNGEHTTLARSPGVVAVSIPAYWLSFSGSAPEDFDLAPGVLTAAALAAGAVALFYLMLSYLLSSRMALNCAAVFALATPIWSVAGNAIWTHSVTVLGVCGIAYAASRDRWWLVGTFGGLALWGRPHTALIVAVVGLGVALARRQPRIALAVGLPAAAWMALASVWTHWLYGSWSPGGGYSASGYIDSVSETPFGDGLSDRLVNQLGMWVSLDRGILVWTPVLLVLLPALIRGWRSFPDWAQWLAIGGVTYTVFQASFSPFMGGDGFYGYRHGLEALVCIAPMAAMAVAHTGVWARRVILPVLAVQGSAILLGSISEGWFVLREDAWTDNSWWLALRSEPLLIGIWTTLAAVIGILATVSWHQRSRLQLGAEPRADAARLPP